MIPPAATAIPPNTQVRSGRRRSAARRLARAASPAAVAIGFGLLVHATLVWERETNHWVRHTHDVLKRVHHATTQLVDAETGQRGFLLTGGERYLEPYRNARPRLEREVAALRALTRDNPRQQRALDTPAEIAHSRLATIDRTIALLTLLASPVAALLASSPAALAAAAPPAAPPAARASAPVMPGVEVLLRDSLHLLRGKRVGLITNHTGRDRAGRSTIDLLYRAPGVTLAALFGPEHGLRGVAAGGERIASTTDSATGVPVFSLYGETLVPTPAMLERVDVLVYDVQDVGARVYTYVWTMALAADAAKKAGKPFVVLDRPNPIRNDRVEGGVLRPAFRSFVSQYPVALRYGLTPGELLRYLVGTGQVRADVTVVPLAGYRRSMWWEETGLPWVNPSPNIRDPETALLYPGTVFFEATNLSEGRGTDKPLRLVGAPWLRDAGAIARELNAKHLPGVRFDSTSRAIAPGQEWGGRRIPMVEVRVTDRDSVRPVDVGAHMLRAIYKRHPRDWRWRANGIEELSGSPALRRAVQREGGVEQLLRDWEQETARFRAAVEKYRLY